MLPSWCYVPYICEIYSLIVFFFIDFLFFFYIVLLKYSSTKYKRCIFILFLQFLFVLFVYSLSIYLFNYFHDCIYLSITFLQSILGHLAFFINVSLKREKGRDLTLFCDKKPYTHRTIQKATWQHKNATKNFDYTTIADRLRTVSWSNSSHPTGVVKPVYEHSTFPLTATAV